MNARAFAADLLRWYDRQKRDLPWRRQPTAYRTLVSELMLQQTVVATVVPYFERFVARWPDVRALAAAAESDVLAQWSGLGYYRRARHLHRAAGAVVASHGGEVPADEATLRGLPGVGEYTAAAVAAIAHGARTFALDGNGARVMARLGDVREPVARPAVRARLRAAGAALVPALRPGDFNQAVMELGALVCVPKTPRCAACPVARHCAARAAGSAAQLPVKTARPARRRVRLACALVERAGRVLLVLRPAGELLGGTWALPSAELARGAAATAAARAAARGAGVVPSSARLSGSARHVFTHRDVEADVVRVTTRRAPAAAAGRAWAAPGDLARLAVSSFTRKTLRAGGFPLPK